MTPSSPCSTPHARRGAAIAGTRACLLALCTVFAVFLVGCLGPQAQREQVYNRRGVVVHLTSMQQRGTPVARGFAHPAHFSAAEIGALIAPIEVEVHTRKNPRLRIRAIHPEIVSDVADALATSFAEAGPDQTLGVQAIRKRAKLLVLNEKMLTSFIASVDGEGLRLQFSRIEWTIPKAKKYQPIPVPREGEKVAKFRVLPHEGARLAGAQGVTLPFSGAGHAGQGGEEPAVASNEAPAASSEAVEEAARALDALAPDTLRALADLEDARRSGSISEAHYAAERARLLGSR